jgi:NADH-ubiquinone oxidoreductase subunit 10
MATDVLVHRMLPNVMQVLRERLKECYAMHGVNHFEKCQEYRDKYMEAAQACVPSPFSCLLYVVNA